MGTFIGGVEKGKPLNVFSSHEMPKYVLSTIIIMHSTERGTSSAARFLPSYSVSIDPSSSTGSGWRGRLCAWLTFAAAVDVVPASLG